MIQISFGIFLILIAFVLVAPILMRLLRKLMKKEKKGHRRWTDPSDAAER